MRGNTDLVYIGTSVLLIAVGAILRFAVTAEVSGVKLDVVGTILIVAGLVALVASLIYMAMWAGRRDRAAAYEPPVPPDRRW